MLKQLENIETAIQQIDTTSEVQITFNEEDYHLFAMILKQIERIADALEKTKEEA